MNTHDKYELPPLPEPDAYLFQHEETGLTEYVDSQQVEWGFEKANPRWQKIHGAFTERQLETYATAAIEADRKRRGEPVACFKCGHAKHGGECVNVAPQPAEPVKVPSDAEIREVFLENGFTIKPGHDDLKPYVYQSARALLARYGSTTDEATKQQRKIE